MNPISRARRVFQQILTRSLRARAKRPKRDNLNPKFPAIQRKPEAFVAPRAPAPKQPAPAHDHMPELDFAFANKDMASIRERPFFMAWVDNADNMTDKQLYDELRSAYSLQTAYDVLKQPAPAPKRLPPMPRPAPAASEPIAILDLAFKMGQMDSIRERPFFMAWIDGQHEHLTDVQLYIKLRSAYSLQAAYDILKK